MHVSSQLGLHAERAKLIEGGVLPSQDCSLYGTDTKPIGVEMWDEKNLQLILSQHLKSLKWEASTVVITSALPFYRILITLKN